MIKLYNENCFEVLKQLEDNSINCVICSPPYYNLRDYNSSLGMEEDSEEYINNLIKIFNEVYRVLKEDGSCG